MGDTPEGLTAELMASIERVRRLGNRISRLLQDDHGLTVYQLGILAAIDEGARHLHQVAEATGQPDSGASRLVDRLVRDGMIDRDADRADRRAVILGLTAQGRRMLEEARRSIGWTMQQALATMPADKADQLLPALGAFLDAAEDLLESRAKVAHRG
jgi:MarR family transcriptional regulator, organic hydroperoxide resistance regulator